MKLFTYGTLQSPEIQEDLFGKRLSGKRAELSGYRKSEIEIQGTTYPIVHLSAGAHISGILYEVTEEQLKRCDEYEGSEYARMFIPEIEAWMYGAAIK